LETSNPFTFGINRSGNSTLLQTSNPKITILEVAPPLPSNQDGKLLCLLSNCPTPDKQLARKRLQEYYTKEHEDAYPVPCPVLGCSCTEEFSSYLHLTTHMKETHLKHGLSLLVAAQSWECRDKDCTIIFHKSGNKRYLNHLVKVHKDPKEVELLEGEGSKTDICVLLKGANTKNSSLVRNNTLLALERHTVCTIQRRGRYT
jgi:hypothetical protein